MKFANKAETVLKWVLNRLYQTKISESWVEINGSSSHLPKIEGYTTPVHSTLFISSW